MSSTEEIDENKKEQILREVQAGNIEVLKQFKKDYPNIHWCNLRYKKTGDTVLHVASRLGYLKIVEYLLAEYEPAVDFKDRDNKTPLHEAAQFAEYNVIRLLLNHSADVNALKRADWTPLMLACTKIQTKSSYKSVELLLQKGALVNYENKDGWTALHIISREGCSEILKLLVEYGLNIFKVTKNGRSALHVAALHGNLSVVKVLLKLGSDINSKDNCGNTALHEAVLGGHINVCKYLLEEHADLSAANNLGFGVLHLAAGVGSADTIKYLVNELSLDVNVRNLTNLTPLHCAARKKYIDAFNVLIQLGADVSVQDNFGRCAADYMNI